MTVHFMAVAYCDKRPRLWFPETQFINAPRANKRTKYQSELKDTREAKAKQCWKPKPKPSETVNASNPIRNIELEELVGRSLLAEIEKHSKFANSSTLVRPTSTIFEMLLCQMPCNCANHCACDCGVCMQLRTNANISVQSESSR